MRELSGVAHNLAHQSQSSLSWLHPHLAQACRLSGVTEVKIELLDANPYPTALPHLRPLVLSLQALQSKFVELLAKQQIPQSNVQSVLLEFRFPVAEADNYSCSVRATITSANGKVFRRNV